MEISINLWGNTGYYLPEGRGKFTLRKTFDDNKTVRQVVEDLGLPKDLVFLVSVNGQVVEGDCVLKDGDEVALFTPNSGG